MPEGYLSNPLMLIANTVLGVYIFVLILRVLLQYSGANWRNPVSNVIIKITKAPLKVLSPFFPTVKNINLSALFLILALQMVLGFIMIMGQPNLWMIFIWSLTEVISSVITIFIYSIFATVILSWINPGVDNPAIELLYKITEPVLKPCRRMIPPIGGFDMSPMVALLGLQVLKMLAIPPLLALM